MAQAKQDLQAIINAAAEKEGLDPELLQKIGGAESGFRAGAKNPKSTAKGLFQFVDKTWAEMGGKPGEQFIPQKNAELGARYVKRNMDTLTQVLGREPSYGEVYAAHFFGPTGAKALLTKADPNAPIEQSLAMFESPKRVQKVLKQNPNLKGKTTAEVLADLDAKMGSKKPVVQEAPTAAAPTAPAKPSSGMFRRPVPRFIRSEAPNLGTGYNAALALMGLTDTAEDELTKAQETVAENEADNEVADFGQARKMLAEIQTPNAFANQQPRLMARGGAVRNAGSEEESPFKAVSQFSTFRPTDTKWIADTNSTLNKYKAEADVYNAAREKYLADVYNPYKTQVDAYNKAVEEHAKLPPGRFGSRPPFSMEAPKTPEAFTMTAPTDPGLTEEIIKQRVAAAQKAAAEDAGRRGTAINAVNRPRDFNLAGFGMAGINAPSMFRDGGDVKKSDKDDDAEQFFKNLVSAAKESAPVDLSFQSPPSQVIEGLGMTSAPPAVSGRIGTNFDALGGNVRIGAQGMAMQTPDKKILTMPGMYDIGYKTKVGSGDLDLSFQRQIQSMPGRGKDYAVNAKYSYKFAEGGEAKAEPEKGSAKAMLKEVGRSTQYLPADIAGAPVDLINLGLQGIDALTGSKLAQKMPVGGSEYLIDKANKYGLMDKPTGSLTETLTRLGTGVLSPTAGPRAVVAAGKAIKGTAKAALEDLSMAGTGQGGSKFAQTLMEPGTAFAVRPKGGVSLGAASAADVPLTRIDEKLKQTVEGIDTSTEQGKEVANFFDKKMRSYYQNQYGTPDDPLFKAIVAGRIQPIIANPRLVDAARAGDPQALKDLRQSYDASTGVQTVGSRKVLDEIGKHPFDMEGDVRKLIKAQSPNENTLMISATGLNKKELEAYPMMYGPKGFKDIVSEGEAGKLMRLMNQTDLPPHVRQAVAKGEPIYATTGGTSRMLPTDEIRDYLFTRTPAEIKNMGVVDVAAKSREWHRKMEAARQNPEKFSSKELFQGTAPVLDVDKYKWVDVKTPDALSLEGNIMGHCVGGSNYCNAVSKETTKIISLRDKKGIPHVTIQLDKTPEGFTRVAQIKGTANNSPEKYFNEVNAFLEDYSAKLGKNLTITERPSFVPPQWKDK